MSLVTPLHAQPYLPNWFTVSPSQADKLNTGYHPFRVGKMQGQRPRRLGLEAVSRPIHGLISVSSRRYVQMSRLVSVLRGRLGLGLDLSGLEPIAIFTQIYLWRFVTKTLSPHKLNWSVNNNPCRMQQNSTICTSSLWHMTSFVFT